MTQNKFRGERKDFSGLVSVPFSLVVYLAFSKVVWLKVSWAISCFLKVEGNRCDSISWKLPPSVHLLPVPCVCIA